MVIKHAVFIPILSQRRARVALVEARLQGWGRAENVIKLIDEGLEVTVNEVIDAVLQRGDLTRARDFLQQECCICLMTYPASQVRINGFKMN